MRRTKLIKVEELSKSLKKSDMSRRENIAEIACHNRMQHMVQWGEGSE